jgi:excisionase family DNA binding protein
MSQPEPMVNVRKLAEHFGPPRSWWYSKAESGECPSYKAGKYRLFKISEVERWLESKRQGPRPE